jgi:hypothetical protein
VTDRWSSFFVWSEGFKENARNISWLRVGLGSWRAGKSKGKYALILNGDDRSFPTDYGQVAENLLKDPQVTHVFAQNLVMAHPKVSPLPIGMSYHTIATRDYWGETRATPRQQEKRLLEILGTLRPTGERILKAFVDFHHTDGMKIGTHQRWRQFGWSRKTVFEKLSRTGLIDSSNHVRQSSLWTTKGKYAFSVSPPGNGLDCHRTWEDLILGCIVIVYRTDLTLVPLYEHLPVVVVSSWDEITLQNLTRWRERYGDAFTNPSYRRRLTMDFWMQRILSKEP